MKMKMKAVVFGMAAAVTAVAMGSSVYAQDADADSRRIERRAGPDGEFRGQGREARGQHGRRGGRHGARGANPARVLERLDVNADGIVDATEFSDDRTGRVDATFNRRDLDGDGLLSREELERRPHLDRPEIDREEVIECVRNFIAEFDPPDALEDRFDTIDTNDDGYVDLTELSWYLEKRAHELFDRLDANDDDVVTLEELEAAHEYTLNLRRVIRYCIDQLADPFDTTLTL